MGTTLVPPSYYVVKPRGRPERRYRTVADAAAAIVRLVPIPAIVSATTVGARRSLTETELRELGRNVRAWRLLAGRQRQRQRQSVGSERPAVVSHRSASGRAARLASVARQAVESLGGRYSTQLGIDVDRGEAEIERWALAATLFGARISANIAARTFAALEEAGVRSIADAGRRDIGELIELLDTGGYARYDLRTAERLHAIADVLDARYGGRVTRVLDVDADELWAALDALPGWGQVTVGLFLRELRGVRPEIEPPLDARALRAAEHLKLLPRGRGARVRQLLDVARAAGLDTRDLEAALVRLSLAHDHHAADCPGGARCCALRPARP
jgi:hypothetical protein